MLWRLLRLMGVVVIGAGSYFATLAVLGFRPRDFARRTV
jgi:putative peptidoglycan lipid II flippase